VVGSRDAASIQPSNCLDGSQVGAASRGDEVKWDIDPIGTRI
jgi:hypothetical protein